MTSGRSAMDELVRKLAELRHDLTSPWSDARCMRLFRGLCRLRRRRRLLAVIGVAAACAGGCVALLTPNSWSVSLAREPSAPLQAAATLVVSEPASDWLSAADRGEYARAYELLAQGAPVANDPETLLRAADAARLSDHPEASIGYFSAVLRDHRNHPATPLAAFTLGRELLEHLGRPVEAAEAFALASQLAREVTLAQDALAREVESWSKAGRAEEAYQRALLFSERYPKSRRLRTVELLGGLRAH